MIDSHGGGGFGKQANQAAQGLGHASHVTLTSAPPTPDQHIGCLANRSDAVCLWHDYFDFIFRTLLARRPYDVLIDARGDPNMARKVASTAIATDTMQQTFLE
jgi:hypothetical protein